MRRRSSRQAVDQRGIGPARGRVIHMLEFLIKVTAGPPLAGVGDARGHR
jgi:hypothetical protein